MRSFSRWYRWKEHHWNILIHEKILDHHIGIFVWSQVSNKLFFWMCVFGFDVGVRWVLGVSWAVVRVNWLSREPTVMWTVVASISMVRFRCPWNIFFTVYKMKCSKFLKYNFTARLMVWASECKHLEPEYFYQPRPVTPTLNLRYRKYWHFLELSAETSSKFAKIKISNIRIEKLF